MDSSVYCDMAALLFYAYFADILLVFMFTGWTLFYYTTLSKEIILDLADFCQLNLEMSHPLNLLSYC